MVVITSQTSQTTIKNIAKRNNFKGEEKLKTLWGQTIDICNTHLFFLINPNCIWVSPRKLGNSCFVMEILMLETIFPLSINFKIPLDR